MNLLFVIHLLFLISAKKVHCVSATLYEYQPEQIHLSFGACEKVKSYRIDSRQCVLEETVRDLVVTWSTNQRTNASVCKYGRNAMESTKVTLKNLKENTCYKYYCGSELGWSRKYWFCVPQRNESWSPSLAIYGDMGLTYAYSLPYLSDDVQNRMYNAVIHNGNFAYNLESEDGERGDLFMKQIENIAAYVPYMVSAGNHEAAYNFSHYRKRFAMPGPVHFVAFSTEVYFYLQFGYEPYCNQYNWLENELRESNKPENRESRPWIVTYGHRPMYCSNDNINECSIKENVIRAGDPNKDLLGLEELFYNYGVDVEIWSHEHSYERSWPLYNYTVLNGSLAEPYRNPRAPVHIITGAAGNIESQDTFFGDLPEWSAFRSQDFGYTRLKAFNNSHLYFEQFSVDKEAVIDKFWISKDRVEPYFKNANQPYYSRSIDPKLFLYAVRKNGSIQYFDNSKQFQGNTVEDPKKKLLRNLFYSRESILYGSTSSTIMIMAFRIVTAKFQNSILSNGNKTNDGFEASPMRSGNDIPPKLTVIEVKRMSSGL
uniref:Purple acid phosphatase n=1 Tax=Glossina pallidipes TaxID=7398 RepID=A0A1A9ZD64_GLOPL